MKNKINNNKISISTDVIIFLIGPNLNKEIILLYCSIKLDSGALEYLK